MGGDITWTPTWAPKTNHQMDSLEILKNTAVSGCKNSDLMIHLGILMVVMDVVILMDVVNMMFVMIELSAGFCYPFRRDTQTTELG